VGSNNILFDSEGNALSPDKIYDKIINFPNRYKEAVKKTIQDSAVLDSNGEVFVNCTARILVNFKMTRTGPFKGIRITKNGNVIGEELLHKCWDRIKDGALEINNSVLQSGFSRDRYLLALSSSQCEELVQQIWFMTKQLLPFTMGETSYGLVGASKILFAVLPEIVLPVDNNQWLKVFKTVDLGDIINRMVCDIKEWEEKAHERLNEMDRSKRLTTLPSVYNVIAMDARPYG